jgi:hypothetical protein
MAKENYNDEINETFTIEVVNDEFYGHRVIMNWTENGEKKSNNIAITSLLGLIYDACVPLSVCCDNIIKLK